MAATCHCLKVDCLGPQRLSGGEEDAKPASELRGAATSSLTESSTVGRSEPLFRGRRRWANLLRRQHAQQIFAENLADIRVNRRVVIDDENALIHGRSLIPIRCFR